MSLCSCTRNLQAENGNTQTETGKKGKGKDENPMPCLPYDPLAAHVALNTAYVIGRVALTHRNCSENKVIFNFEDNEYELWVSLRDVELLLSLHAWAGLKY